MKRIAIAAGLLLAWNAAALAQSSPGLVYGQVPTAAQWNSYFSAKQDTLGYTPVNKAGDVMTGRLVLPASTTIQASLNVPAGTAPTTPLNGDIWTTTAGIFARINGATIGPLTSSASGSFAATLPLSVSFPASVVTYALNVGTGLSVSGSNLILTAPVASSLGGTGINNGSATLTLAANVTHAGAFATTITATGVTNSTLPSGTHTLAGLDVGQLWTGSQFFGPNILNLAGATSGTIILTAPAIAGTNTITFPAGTTNFSATGGTSQFVKQASAGAAFTVVRPACADLSDSTTACSTSIGTSAATIPLLNGTNTWSGLQNYVDSVLTFAGSTSGSLSIRAAAIAGTSVIRFPAGSTDFSATGGSNQFVKQTSSGGALTVAAILAADLPLGSSSAFGAVKVDNVTITATAGVISAVGASATSITVGTTTIGSGTTNGLLYNNAGILGNLASANGGLLNTSSSGVPSVTATPLIGVAGSTVGTLAFANATSGSVKISPATGALGTTTWTLPGVTDQFVGLATTDTLTNKTLTNPTVSGTLAGSITLSGTNTYTGTATFNTTMFNPGVSGGVGNQYFCFTNGTGQFTASASPCGTSDARMKKVSGPLSAKKGLDAVLALQPVYYDWLDVTSAKAGPQIGLLAQNVATVLPEVAPVNEDMMITLADGRKVSIPHAMSVDYPKLVVPLIAAVQELHARITALEKR